ncbi:phenylalanyl-tRNA synthetase, beta subunit [Chloroherpeton thalassium ATCC 35110]|uniref:Phenylalanine--tRNA ligase beta subunit n=1 Tax=Chloroherpeton thalassium (strain ATCC 35110 / GB-78) TaxID=517418 RepID=B3QS30_CHLT3|nr:phenylalanine--tRNA ligase subunit beta [Chloroherpeton thalassium]ACF13975.1 phenylalanyl-tRNA synthetase, beta subunit [Chloroherpeton thalassium ATCC 35110]
MKISLNWLKSFAPDLNLTSEELEQKLTALGLEVEGVQELCATFSNVVVGKLLETAKHPNADKLTVCQVDAGTGETLQIVCGAPNVAAGQTVAVALVGATLQTPSGDIIKIKKSKIRGETSLGMICAEDELGLSDNHDGILVLDETYPIGEPFEKYVPKDTIFEIGITPNRADALSHFGIARDLIGVDNVTDLDPDALDFNPSTKRIVVEDPENCPIYTAVVIKGVNVAESPAWLKERLQSIGLRPINNIVDITNYILHSLGQPLHAFDLNRLSGKCIQVKSNLSETFVTLDGKERQIEPGMVMICDAEKPVAVGGVMGGQNSEITDTTIDILLESAYFKPSSVRKTAKKLGISTDSSYRFERGVDFGNVHFASEAAVHLILELAGGSVEEVAHVASGSFDEKLIAFRPARANALLGADIPAEKMQDILMHLGFKKSGSQKSDDAIEYIVPSFRVDVEQEIDLIEEVARVYGYDNLAVTEKMTSAYPAVLNKKETFDDYVRNLMIGLNFKELLTNPLLKYSEAESFSTQIVRTLNPISEDMEALRPSLIPSVLKVISRNIHYGNTEQRLFEVAHTFEKCAESAGAFVPGYNEKERLCLAVTGKREPLGWAQSSTETDFYDLKGAVEMLLQKLKLLEKSKFITYNRSCLQLELTPVDGKKAQKPVIAGLLYQLEKNILDTFDIKQPVFVAELDMDVLKDSAGFETKYSAPAKFPVVHRDLAFLLPKQVKSQDVMSEIHACSEMIQSVNVFDVYEKNDKQDRAYNEKRSIAFSFSIVCYTHTLAENEINALVDKIVTKVTQKFGAELRQA